LPTPARLTSEQLLGPRAAAWPLALLAAIGLAMGCAGAPQAKELRRQMAFIRPLLMGDANVAVGDESSTLFYNPAGVARLPANAYEILTPQIIVSDEAKAALVDSDALAAKYQNLSQAQMGSLLGTKVLAQANIRMPVVSRAAGGAWGMGVEQLANIEILNNSALPGVHLETYTDALVFDTYAGMWGDRLAVGITPKLVARKGLDKVFTFGELFATGNTVDLNHTPEYKNFQNGNAVVAGGADLGFIYRLQAWESWAPRLGVSLLNIGGYDNKAGLKGIEFGARPTPYDPPIGGEIPQINTVGVAVSPEWSGIRLTLALDVVDVTRTVLPGPDWYKRTRLGMEIGIGVRKDGTALLSILGGFNATHPSFGLLTRSGFVEAGLGTYSVELGQKPGDDREQRTVLLFGIRI